MTFPGGGSGAGGFGTPGGNGEPGTGAAGEAGPFFSMSISGSFSCRSPSTPRLSTPSQSSSRVAYTRRKSVWYFRSPSVRSDRLGCLPTSPPATLFPARNMHDPDPWSVPRLPFSFTRRPNSEYVISTTRSAASGPPSAPKNCPTAFDSVPSRSACIDAWPEWVSNPPSWA